MCIEKSDAVAATIVAAPTSKHTTPDLAPAEFDQIVQPTPKAAVNDDAGRQLRLPPQARLYVINRSLVI